MNVDCTLQNFNQGTIWPNNISHTEINMSNTAPEHICSRSFRMEINGVKLGCQLSRTSRIAEVNSCPETLIWFSSLITLPIIAHSWQV